MASRHGARWRRGRRGHFRRRGRRRYGSAAWPFPARFLFPLFPFHHTRRLVACDRKRAAHLSICISVMAPSTQEHSSTHHSGCHVRAGVIKHCGRQNLQRSRPSERVRFASNFNALLLADYLCPTSEDQHRGSRRRKDAESVERDRDRGCTAEHIHTHTFRRRSGLRRSAGLRRHHVFVSGISPCGSTERKTEHRNCGSEQRSAQAGAPVCCCHTTILTPEAFCDKNILASNGAQKS